MNASDLSLWLVGAIGALIASLVLVLLKWKTYQLPMKLLPFDVLTVVLLIDLNIKSLNNVTVDNMLMKLEAITFTGLLTFVLFAPVLWKVSQSARKSKAR